MGDVPRGSLFLIQFNIVGGCPTAISLINSFGVYSVARFFDAMSNFTTVYPSKSPSSIGFSGGDTSGEGKLSGSIFLRATSIKERHIGAAARTPDPFCCMGVLSLFPDRKSV